MKPEFEWNGIKVYMADIVRRDGESARMAERRSVEALIASIFGAGVSLGHTADGAPYLTGADECISVSHGAGRAVVAVSNCPIGVDIEAPRDQLQRIEHKFRCEADSRELSLLQLWTAKEAVFKAANCPALTISQIAILSACEAIADNRRFSLTYFPLPDGAMIALGALKIYEMAP